MSLSPEEENQMGVIAENFGQSATRNYFDIIDGFDTFLDRVMPSDVPYFAMGGAAAEFLRMPDTTFDDSNRFIVPNEQPWLSQFRPSGSKRDLDVLALTTDDELLAEANDTLRLFVGGALEVSVFGVKDHEQHMARSGKLAHDFLTERTMDADGNHYYTISNVAHQVKPESYEQWGAVNPNGTTIPVMHPMAQVLCYTFRSISGVRHKDKEKWLEMAETVIPRYSELTQNPDSEFYEWAQYTAIIDAMSRGEIGDTRAEQLVYMAKARGLGFLESFQKIVDLVNTESMQEGVLKTFIGKQ